MNFRVDLDTFRGPLDLLLYLVRKHEVEIVEIPIHVITDQFLAYIEVLEQIDVNAAGDFLEMASTLIEIKSRLVLPRGDEEQGEIEDPRQDLVHRLLEYKKYRDAASMLEDQGRQWQQRYTRVANDLPTRRRELADEPISEVELWDLVSAFARILKEARVKQPSNIVYDDTPIHVFMQQIGEQLRQQQRLAFSRLFEAGMHKSTQIGMFLAILELVRHYQVRTEQDELFEELYVLLPENGSLELDPALIDGYEHKPA